MIHIRDNLKRNCELDTKNCMEAARIALVVDRSIGTRMNEFNDKFDDLTAKVTQVRKDVSPAKQEVNKEFDKQTSLLKAICSNLNIDWQSIVSSHEQAGNGTINEQNVNVKSGDVHSIGQSNTEL